MKIGVLSDSHGRVEMTARAVSLLRDAGAERLIHLGDVETERVLEELLALPTHIVFGNCDWDIAGLTRYAQSLGLTVAHPSGQMEVAGRRIAFTHGHLESRMHAALAEGVEYLLHGHTHELRDERIGDTRVINPGALFRARRYTAAVLDVATDTLHIIDVPRDS